MLKTCLSKFHNFCYFMIAACIYIIYIYIYIYIYTIYMYRYIYTHIHVGKTLYIQSFYHWGNGRRVSSHQPKICLSPPNLEKFLPSRLPPLPPLPPHYQIFIPPTITKQQFSSYNLIKTAFLAVVIALAPFLF